MQTSKKISSKWLGIIVTHRPLSVISPTIKEKLDASRSGQLPIVEPIKKKKRKERKTYARSWYRLECEPVVQMLNTEGCVVA